MLVAGIVWVCTLRTWWVPPTEVCGSQDKIVFASGQLLMRIGKNRTSPSCRIVQCSSSSSLLQVIEDCSNVMFVVRGK